MNNRFFCYLVILLLAFSFISSLSFASAKESYSFDKFWGGNGTEPGKFKNILGTALLPAIGLIYVADHNNNRVQVFNPKGDFSGQYSINHPSIIAIDRTNYLYVASTDNGLIKVFSLNPNIADNNQPLVKTLDTSVYPLYIALDPRGAYLFVLSDNYKLNKFKTSNGEKCKTSFDQITFSNPQGLAIGSKGNVYVSDSGKIYKYDAWGHPLDFQSPTSLAANIAIDAQDKLYISIGHGIIIRCNLEGKNVVELPGFGNTLDILINNKDKTIYTRGRDYIFKFNHLDK